MALGARIKEERDNRGWTQTQLVNLVNERLPADFDGTLSQQALGALEKRDSTTSEFAVYLADVLGVSLRWLLTGAGRRTDLEWPFNRVDQARWDAADDTARGYVQSAMNRALDECEADGPVGSPALVPAEFALIWQALPLDRRQTWLRDGRALLPVDAPVKL